MSTKPLRVGVSLHQQHISIDEFIETVRRAEAMNVDTIFDCDHFFPLYGDPQGNHFEGWTLLSAMAMLTQRAEVGCLVTCAGYRNPALLSNMAKTVDHLSHGRLILGLGAGMFERDYREYGYEFGTPGSRLHTLEQTLQIIQKRWEVDIPRPTRKIPVLLGGNGEQKTLRLVARYADIWHGFGDPAMLKHKIAVLRRWCEEVGRDPGEIECSVSPSRKVSTGELDAYVEAGVTHFIVGLGVPAMNVPRDFAAVEKILQWRDNRSRSVNL